MLGGASVQQRDFTVARGCCAAQSGQSASPVIKLIDATVRPLNPVGEIDGEFLGQRPSASAPLDMQTKTLFYRPLFVFLHKVGCSLQRIKPGLKSHPASMSNSAMLDAFVFDTFQPRIHEMSSSQIIPCLQNHCRDSARRVFTVNPSILTAITAGCVQVGPAIPRQFHPSKESVCPAKCITACRVFQNLRLK